MTNHTNVDGNKDMNYDDPGFLLVGLILFLSFCSILCSFYYTCIKDAGIKKFCNKCFPCLHKENTIEYEVRYDSDSDSDYEIEKVDDNVLEIKKIPTFANVNNYPIYCSICQEEKINTVKVDCGHNFCKECILGYTKVGNECPNCREGIHNIYEIEVLVFK